MHVNNDFQKNSNISHIMATLWHNNRAKVATSRIDISKSLDLYRSTVSNVIQTLVENKVILEGPAESSGDKTGRKPINLKINPEFGCVVGIELQIDAYNICICNFDGTILFSKKGTAPKFTGTSEERFTSLLETVTDEACACAGKLDLPLLSICCGIPGIIDTDKGIIVSSEPFGLNNFPYPAGIAEKYGVPLLLENDAKCCSWYIKAESAEKPEQDYLCVLTKNHDTQGISVGLSLTLNGRVINGHNHAVGEYVSSSWLPSKNSQTGLAQAVLSTVNIIEDSYREWVKDLFSTLTTFIPLLEPQTVYLFGQGEERSLLINEVIENEVTQFRVIMNRCGSALKILPNDDSLIANGAALMFVQKLFEIPSLGSDSVSHITWEQVFDIQKKGAVPKE